MASSEPGRLRVGRTLFAGRSSDRRYNIFNAHGLEAVQSRYVTLSVLRQWRRRRRNPDISGFIFLFENNCTIITNVTFTCMEHLLNMVNVSDQFFKPYIIH